MSTTSTPASFANHCYYTDYIGGKHERVALSDTTIKFDNGYECRIEYDFDNEPYAVMGSRKIWAKHFLSHDEFVSMKDETF